MRSRINAMAMRSEFDAYHKWLGIPRHQQPPTHYRILGLEPFESDPDVIQAAAERQMAHIQSYKIGPQSDLSQRLLNEIAKAKVCLLDPDCKADYDRSLRESHAASATARLPESPASHVKQAIPDDAALLTQIRAAPVRTALVFPGARPWNNDKPRRRRQVLPWIVWTGVGVLAVTTLVVFLTNFDLSQRARREPVLTPAPIPVQTDVDPTPAVDRDGRTEWVNSTYDNRLVWDEGKIQERTADGRVADEYFEVARTRDYVEISTPKNKRSTRLFTNTAQQLVNGNWAWVSFGHWASAEGEARLAEVIRQPPPPVPQEDARGHWINDTYRIGYERVDHGKWDQVEAATGNRDVGVWKETARNTAYIELFNLKHRFYARLHAEYEEVNLDGKWKRSASGKWDAPKDRTTESSNDGAIELQDDGPFKPLFNGRDLTGWKGHLQSYSVKNGVLTYNGPRPSPLVSEREFSDFHLRFDYRLTSGADSGIGFWTPADLHGDSVVLEVQLLDEFSPGFQGLPAIKKNASCGVAAARQGRQHPVGVWNSEEVIVRGNHIQVLLNGHEVLNADFVQAETERLDTASYPALSRDRGHLALLGHTGRVEFRNIMIADLPRQEIDPSPVPQRQPLEAGGFSDILLPSGRVISEETLTISWQQIKSLFTQRLRSRTAASSDKGRFTFVLNDSSTNSPAGLLRFTADGTLSGPALVVDGTGQPSVLISFAGGERHGTLRSWGGKGDLVLWSEYKVGKKTGITCLCNHGIPVRVEEWENGRRRSVYLIVTRDGSTRVVESRDATESESKQLDVAEKTLLSIERLLRDHERQWKSTFRAWFRQSQIDEYQESGAGDRGQEAIFSRF